MPNPLPMTVSGGFRSLESEIGGSIGGSSHEQPNPIDLIENRISLKCKSGKISIGSSQILTRSSQISMRSIEIRPNLNEILLRSSQLSPPLLLHHFRSKPTLSTRLETESNRVFQQSEGGQTSCHLKWSGRFWVRHKPDPWTGLGLPMHLLEKIMLMKEKNPSLEELYASNNNVCQFLFQFSSPTKKFGK